MISKIKARIKPLMVDRVARRLIITAAVLNFAAWAVLLMRFVPAIRRGIIVALHYNVYLNVDEVGSAWYALVPAALGLVFGIVNVGLASRAYAANRANALVFLTVTVFYEALLLLAAVFIVLINVSR
jgi:hypothetical protein